MYTVRYILNYIRHEADPGIDRLEPTLDSDSRSCLRFEKENVIPTRL